MKKYMLLATLMGAAFSSPAFAQDDTDSSFAGFRLEALAGYDNVEKDDGFVYGVAAGYDLRSGNTVLGLEAELNDSTVRESYTDLLVAGDSANVKAGRDIYVGARLGFAVSPASLIYAKAGYSNARIKGSYDDGTTVETGGVNADGYRLGAGIEQQFTMFGPSGYAKLEYRYSNYGNVNFAGGNVDIDADRHQVLAGLGFRF